jgi:hypothetical protein
MHKERLPWYGTIQRPPDAYSHRDIVEHLDARSDCVILEKLLFDNQQRVIVVALTAGLT